MIKIIIRAIYAAFISIVLASIILAGWTCFAFISQPTKSDEIINTTHNIYESQKSVITGIVDLSKLLVKDKGEKIANNDSFLTESELLINEEKSLPSHGPILEDKGNNPLGIVIESTLPEVTVKDLPEINAEPLDNDQSDVLTSEREIGMEMN